MPARTAVVVTTSAEFRSSPSRPRKRSALPRGAAVEILRDRGSFRGYLHAFRLPYRGFRSCRGFRSYHDFHSCRGDLIRGSSYVHHERLFRRDQWVS